MNRLELLKAGQEDVYISGNPSTSFFRSVYKGSSYRYSYLLKEVSVDGSLDSTDSIIEFKIPTDLGDLVKNIYLKVSLTVTSESLYRYFYDFIDYADFKIGGQIIQRLSGEMMYNIVTLTSGTNEIETLNKNTYTGSTAGKVFLYVPLPFYFYNDISRCVPLCALNKHRVSVDLKFRKFFGATIINLTYVTYYIKLDQREKIMFTDSDLQYTITQVQCFEEKNISKESFLYKQKLNFINPVRELFFLCSPGVSRVRTSGGADFFDTDYSYNNSTDPTSFRPDWIPHMSNIKLFFNGEIAVDLHEQYMSAMVPTTKYLYPMKFIQRYGYLYSFAENPMNNYNTGSVNMSRIRDQTVHINFESTILSGTRSIRIYAVSYNVLRVRDGLGGLMFFSNNNYEIKI